jgi:hypothetical protein
LLVFLLGMMVQIVEHRTDTLEDFVVEEEAASNHPVTGATVVHVARHHTPAQVSQTPSRAAPGALSAVRELLRHPTSSTASSGAMKQWCDNVDRLLSMAHSTSIRSRPRSSRRQHAATASVRSPSVRGAQTDDLREELNRRCVGEDARVSLERAREPTKLRGSQRRSSLSREGARAPAKHRGSQPRSRLCCGTTANLSGRPVPSGCPLAGVGCAALADHLHAASWPSKFRPQLPEKYNGTSNPSEFLQVYVTAITAAGGNTAVMATYFHVALSGPAQTWLMNLALGSIYSWEELCARFTVNFASAYQ